MIDHDHSKRARNRHERRTAIVEIARQQFLDNGYAATTMSAVAEAMGGSKATLWAHFSSKESLFADVIGSLVDGFAQRMDMMLASRDFTREGLREFCVGFVERLMEAEPSRLFRLLMAEGDRFPELGALFHARGPERMIAGLERYLATRIPTVEAARIARIACFALVGFRTDALILGRAHSPAATAAFVDDLIDRLRFD